VAYTRLLQYVTLPGLHSLTEIPSFALFTMSDGAIDATGSFTHDNNVAPDTSSILKLFSLKGKTAIVSGAGAGIGLQVADAYAEVCISCL
jgi:hypothetical protein